MAPPRTKKDLRALTEYVYSNARVNADYQDAALACLMWHSFGRSSDLEYIQKEHVSVSADSVFYLRLLRVKTAEEQGFTLVPDKNSFLSCPLHALAVREACSAVDLRQGTARSRALSGWGVDEKSVVEDVETLGHGTQDRVARLQELLYSSCSGLKERRFNVSRKVLAVLTAYLIKYFHVRIKA
ncbi:hypothetical protein PI124_g23496 [Phytophthora idaei]|nr:hypothetical protein PI124_g23496 [Phytophthora idaei]